VKDFIISPLERKHNRKSFSCGLDSLDSYLHIQAGQDKRKRIAVTYVLEDQCTNKISGYYTLSATAIELNFLPESVRKKLPSYPCIPATLIGRLAVDENYKKRGLGETILIDAMKRAYHASLSIASFAIVVDAINSNAKSFYKKYGFLELSAVKRRLFLPMSVIAKL